MPWEGGADDVLANEAIGEQYREARAQDIVFPRRNGEYRISAIGDAQVVLPDGNVQLFAVEEEQVAKPVSSQRSPVPRSVTTVAETLQAETLETDEEGKLKLRTGEWLLKIGAGNKSLSTEVSKSKASLRDPRDLTMGEEVYVEYENGPYKLDVTLDESVARVGTRLRVTLAVVDVNGNTVTGFKKVKARVKVVADNSVRSTRRMLDNGAGAKGDAKASDGRYSSFILAKEEGNSDVLVIFKGLLNGKRVSLSTNIVVAVSPNRLKLVDRSVHATPALLDETVLENGRYGIPLAFRTVRGSMPEIVETYAEVWGVDIHGNDSLVGWTGGLVKTKALGSGNYRVPYSFHSGWLDTVEIYAPFSVRNIAIKDIRRGDQILLGRNQLALSGITRITGRSNGILGRTKNSVSTPSSAMTRGVHPSLINPLSRQGTSLGSDRIILSLHGFCDPNEKPLGSFNTTIQSKGVEFKGANNGESATEYAVEIMESLRFRPGKVRGIVAHSHGGMAAASLLQNFSYVFVDANLSKTPNVIAMGTPFWGTSLLNGRLGSAGAFLASVFDEAVSGCNIPSELFPQRNRSWSNSIGSRARSQIASWVTKHKKPKSFKGYRCDNFGSVVIKGSDDGVIANRDGLGFAKFDFNTGYSRRCHTSGMNYPDQWTYGPFIDYVNNTFSSYSEPWQPF